MKSWLSTTIVAVIATTTYAGAVAPGDCDDDCDSDLTDFADYQLCFTGPGGGPVAVNCTCADFDDDGDVDLADFGAFQPSFAGPGQSVTGFEGPCSFPDEWIHGANCARDPLIQVHQYDANTYILRQSICTNFEAPFMYLLFGDDRVLMQDTGAGGIPIANTVYDIIDDWLTTHGKTSIELIVTHSHSHGDHVQGDGQFIGQPNTSVVGLSVGAVSSFFGISPWPTDIVEYDLGGRTLDVIPLPGHQSAHIALYDRNTGIVFTGDTLYPGRSYVFGSYTDYVNSLNRLVNFLEDKPVSWVLGTHIEISETGTLFPVGSSFHANEHPLQLTMNELLLLRDEAVAMAGSPSFTLFEHFAIAP
jgi:glyoxylase-like metal-dependent hydrolase (beta-lactamase superfamily II)